MNTRRQPKIRLWRSQEQAAARNLHRYRLRTGRLKRLWSPQSGNHSCDVLNFWSHQSGNHLSMDWGQGQGHLWTKRLKICWTSVSRTAAKWSKFVYLSERCEAEPVKITLHSFYSWNAVYLTICTTGCKEKNPLPHICPICNQKVNFCLIHFVADHFSPSRTAHPLWRLLESVLPSSPWNKALN